MQTHSHFGKPTFLEQLDIFGIAIAIRFNTLPSHNTRFGGIITLSIIGIIVYQLITVINVLFSQTTPSVIFSDDYVSQPEPFQIKSDTFNFAIGLQDSNFIQFMDEKIYTVKGTQQILEKVYNKTTGDYDQKWSFKNIQLIQCNKNNFQIEQSQDYFLKLPYTTMYCFKPDEENAVIEGEFSASVYKAIVLEFIECIGDGCASQDVKDKFIKSPTLGLFMSNNIIQIKEKEDPKLSIGKNLYWLSGPSLMKYITINLVNNYINSDFSYYGKSEEKKRVVSFSSSGEQVLPRTDPSMFRLTIVYEKNREINYYRKYLKLDEAFSQLGGMFNGLLAIGFLICQPLSQLELNRKLLNSVFNISQEDQEELEKDRLGQGISPKNKIESGQLKESVDGRFSGAVAAAGGMNDSQKLRSPNLSKADMDLKKSQDVLKSIKNQAPTKKKEDINADVTNFFKVQFSELQIKFRDYLANYLRFFKRFQTAKSKLITYGTNKLYNQIDIFYIINKMIEIEKLKHLLLNESQIKLFEYLPRPQLKLEEVIEDEVKEEQQKVVTNDKQIQNTDNNNNSFNSPNPAQTEETKKKGKISKSREKSQKFTIFAQDDKTPLEKAQDAQRAFNQIQKKNVKRSQIDEKLIRMLDPKLVNMFMENSFDFGQADGDEDSEDMGKRGMDKSSILMKKSIFQQNDATFKIDKTIIELEEEEENKDIFNVSGILQANNQSNEGYKQSQNGNFNERNVTISLVNSQHLEGQTSLIQNQNSKENMRQNSGIVQTAKAVTNYLENTEYLDSNNQSLISTPLTTQRKYQDNTQILQYNKEKLTGNDALILQLNDSSEGIEDGMRNEGDREVRATIPSATRNYFEENSKMEEQH